MEITKHRSSTFGLWTSTHFIVDDKSYHYSYDGSGICCKSYKLGEINNAKYKYLWKISYCAYKQTEKIINKLLSTKPQIVKDLEKYLKENDIKEIG